MRAGWKSFFSAFFVISACVVTARAVTKYTVTDLGTLPPRISQAFGVNDAGQVVGYSAGRPFLWDSVNGMQQLGDHIGTAYGINSNRQVVGDLDNRAFLSTDGVLTDLGTLGGRSSFAYAINFYGQVVGSAKNAASFTRGFLWEAGVMRDLGTLGAPFTEQVHAYGLNDVGQIVGDCFDGTEDNIDTMSNRAFLWENGLMRYLGNLGTDFSVAKAINNNGQIVGYADTPEELDHLFLWQDGAMTDLGVLPGFWVEPFGINNHGQIVGQAFGPADRAFLYSDGQWIDLNDRIDPASGWLLTWATAINESGQIVGSGIHNGEVRAFLLTPLETAQLGINCNNDGSMRDGVPDVDFVIDEEDERVKQTIGFNFWWARDSSSDITEQNIVDLAPFFINVPQKLVDEGHDFFLKLESDAILFSLIVYPAVSPSDNRRAFLQSETMAARQISQNSLGLQVINDSFNFLLPPATLILHGGTNEFLMKAIGSGSVDATLKLVSRRAGESEVVHDSVKLTFRDTSDYWLFASTRGNPVDDFIYPIDDGRFVTINRFPYPVIISGNRDAAKSQYVVFLHGYNVDQTAARVFFDEMYRRFFWLGFRGNFVGLTWRGDQGNAVTLDTNARNALRTSPAVWRFLRDTMQTQWSVPAENINLLAHSLGNLVMFDALRLQSRLVGAPLVQNVCSLQSATWPEAYELETTFASQQPPGLTYVAPSDPVTYSIDQLKKHSWAFWFGQSGAEVSRVINGGIYHSYFNSDIALTMMQYNDWWQRGWLQDWWHYKRDQVSGASDHYRAPANDNSYHPDLANDMPTLMLAEHRHYRTGFFVLNRFAQDDINEPVGAQENPMAKNYPALLGNWQGPRAFWDIGSHSRHSLQSFPSIYKWFDEFLGDYRQKQNSRIPIGTE